VEALIRVVVLDFYDCNKRLLNDVAKMKTILLGAAEVMGATIVDHSFTRFDPKGVSGVVIIAESHLAVHTWPEYGYVAVTFETCGNRIRPWKALPYLKTQLGAKRVSQVEMLRGLFDVPRGKLPHKPKRR
jgi:S-adenosylmethionine decarboxylase proenzyme